MTQTKKKTKKQQLHAIQLGVLPCVFLELTQVTMAILHMSSGKATAAATTPKGHALYHSILFLPSPGLSSSMLEEEEEETTIETTWPESC